MKSTRVLLLLAVLVLTAVTADAQDVRILYQGSWTKGGYAISGGWSIVEEDGKRFVELDSEFKTQRAPDLKIFLSPLALAELGDRNATKNSALVAPLVKHRGEHRYLIPADVDLDEYRSIIIHCEQYSKYWGGAALAASSG